MILVLAAASGCATIDNWKQEHREAAVRRGQAEAAATREEALEADRASKAKQTQTIAQLRHLQSELVTHGDADSLAAGALLETLLVGFPNATALDLTTRAVGRAPERTDLVLLQLQQCETIPGCNALPLEVHLRALDPHNGITWIYALFRADRENRPQDRAAVLAGLARSSRVDLYWSRTVFHLASAMSGKAGLDFGEAVRRVIASESGLSALFEPLAGICGAQETELPDALIRCRQIAAALRHADTGLVEAYGTSLAIRLWPSGSVERQAVIAERRALRYRADLLARHAAQINSARAVRILAGLLPQYPTEQGVYRALFIRLGLNPDPPAHWIDLQPEG